MKQVWISSSLSLFPPYRDLQNNIHIIYKVSETRLFINAYKSNISLYMQEWYEKKILKDNYLHGI